MIKRLFSIILIAFACFFGINSVYAIDDMSFLLYEYSASMDGHAISYDDYLISAQSKHIPLNINFRIRFDAARDEYDASGLTKNGFPMYFYERVTFCATGTMSNAVNISNSLNPVVYDTNIDCRIMGDLSLSGKVYFFISRVGLISGNVNDLDYGITASYWNSSDIFITSGSYSILDLDVSTSPFPAYSSEDSVLNKLDEISDKLDANVSSNGNITYYLEQNNAKMDEQTKKIEQTNEKLDSVNNSLKETNDTLNDDDTSESTSEATEFFEGFDTDTHGLTSIITAPLELIGNIAGSTCSPLPLQVPFVNKTMSLPCISTIYKKHFGSFLTVYQTITFGIVAYWVCVRIFALVKDFKNPEHDEIEVMDL